MSNILKATDKVTCVFFLNWSIQQLGRFGEEFSKNEKQQDIECSLVTSHQREREG